MSDVIEVNETEAFRLRLRDLMDQCGGIKAFSELTDIPYQTARQYLVKSEPTRPVLCKIAERLKVNPSWLLLGTGAKSSDAIAERESEYFRYELRRRLKSDSDIEPVAQDSLVDSSRLTQLRQSAEPTLSEAIRLCQTLGIDTFPSPATSEFDGFSIISELDPDKFKESLNRDFDFREVDKALYSEQSQALKPGNIAIKMPEIETRFNGDMSSLSCYRMPDNKLYPEVIQGALLLIDLNDQSLDDGELFLCKLDGRLSMRIARRKDNYNWFLLRSLDDQSEPYLLEDLALFGCIIGRKVGIALA